MIEDLKSLGLTDGEAKVYLAMLELGSITVGPIVKRSGISYSKIYEVLQRLIEKGLVSFIIKEKTKYFQAVDPKRLYEFLEKKETQIEENKERLRQIIPRLDSLKKAIPKKEEAEIFIGLKGLRTAYERLFDSIDRKEAALFFYVYDDKYAEEINSFYNKIFPYFKRINVKLKGVTSEKFKKTAFIKDKPPFIEVRFVSFPVPANIDIYQDKVLQIAWDKKPIGILIHSQEIANNYKAYFNSLWGIAKS